MTRPLRTLRLRTAVPSLPAGVKVARFLTGSYVTSLEMAGCSITVSAADSATLALWDAPVHTAALRWGV